MFILPAAVVAIAMPVLSDALGGAGKRNLRPTRQAEERELYARNRERGHDMDMFANEVKYQAKKGSSSSSARSPPTTTAPPEEDDPAETPPGGEDRTERYIVTFRTDSQSLMQVGPAALCSSMALQSRGTPMKVFSKALSGCSVELTPSAARALKGDPNIKTIEKNGPVTASYANPLSWGLDRVDQLSLPLDETGTRLDATGVRVYILDTGLRGTHNDLASSISTSDCHFSAITAEPDAKTDGSGHGTHVGSTACGAQYGVAQNCELCAVKVLSASGSGSYEGVIAGIDFVAENCDAPKGCVINMSLGGGYSLSVNEAVAGAHDAGVTVVVAAGNENTDACTKSPASELKAITVGSTNDQDIRSSFSNYGTCTDVYAPGSGITAAWKNSDSDTNTISGTSMASPHVAGIAAGILGVNPNMSPDAVAAQIDLLSTRICSTNANACDPINSFIDLATSVSLCEGCTPPPTPAPTPAPPTPAPTPCTGLALTVNVLTDNYPSETTWTLKNTCTGQEEASGGPYSSAGTLYTADFCVPDGAYDFEINDAYGDGICCAWGEGSYEVVSGSNTTLVEGGEFGDSETQSFGTCGAPTPTLPPVAPTPPPVAPTTPPTGAPTSNPTPAPMSTPPPTVLPPPPLSRPCIGDLVQVRVVTDDHPEDSGWTITDVCTGEVVLTSPEYTETSHSRFDSYCLPESQYMFSMTDAWGDGLAEGKYEVYWNEDMIASGADFGWEKSSEFGLGCNV